MPTLQILLMMMNLNNCRIFFWEYLLASNKEYLHGFKRWIFQPGMLFNSWEQWWGDKKTRPDAHQGLDICLFEDTDGNIKNVDIHLRIPAAFGGEIVKIEPDFLGQSIYIGHHIFTEDEKQFYTVYGHTAPLPEVIVGKKLAAGELLGEIADVPAGTSILPHLHLTLAWIPVAFNPERLNWQNLADDQRITLLDPLSVLAIPGHRGAYAG